MSERVSIFLSRATKSCEAHAPLLDLTTFTCLRAGARRFPPLSKQSSRKSTSSSKRREKHAPEKELRSCGKKKSSSKIKFFVKERHGRSDPLFHSWNKRSQSAAASILRLDFRMPLVSGAVPVASRFCET